MPKLLDIITHPDPILRKVSSEISPASIHSEEMQELFEDMALTMVKKDGVGLAAPQIGQNIRVIVISLNEKVLTMINPQIIKKSWAKKWGEEGCLSVPKVFGDVLRHKKLICTFYDRSGNKQKVELSDMLARIIQHEIDHLDGILFIDKAQNAKKEK